MQEGLEKDDLYSMVEDELLATAQKFTVHLHAAEYKRYQKEVQSRNAQTINTISRTSVGDLAKDTKRKIEAVQRTQKQKRTLDNVLGPTQSSRSDDEDESDAGADLPYAGTMLHDLMDSPRKRVKTLSSITPRTTISRSAAGYRKPATLSQQNSHDLAPLKQQNTRISSSDDLKLSPQDDDDLDAIFNPKRPSDNPRTTLFSSSSRLPTVDESRKGTGSEVLDAAGTTTSTRAAPRLSLDTPPEFSKNRPRVSRFERAKQLKERVEREKMKKNSSLEIIPTFL